MFRNPPHNVDEPSLVILLQHENTWTLVILGIVLDHRGIMNSGNDIPDQDILCGQFIIAMIRYPHLLTGDKFDNPPERRTLGPTHSSPPEVIPRPRKSGQT